MTTTLANLTLSALKLVAFLMWPVTCLTWICAGDLLLGFMLAATPAAVLFAVGEIQDELEERREMEEEERQEAARREVARVLQGK
jgi:cobalamin biosynthesis protein CobD/CbiB